MEVYMEDGCGREEYLQGLFEVPYDALELTMPNDTLLCNGARHHGTWKFKVASRLTKFNGTISTTRN